MEMAESTISGLIYDPIGRKFFGGKIQVKNGSISNIEHDDSVTSPVILPGFVDSHVHIESSMLTPVNFAKTAVRHGTIAAVADPHEIANVAGVDGVDFMIKNVADSSFKFYFGAPSCVPASPFDECYQPFTPDVIETLMGNRNIHFLAEMMNFPGVINGSESVLRIIKKAKEANKPVDGHAPGLTSEALKSYVSVGISTDHECFTLKEALEKIALGMMILIREGSAAKNFAALHPLIKNYSASLMFCTDDCHPDELLKGHINQHVKKSLELGYDIFNILQLTSVNPVKHYKLNVGLLQKGDTADFIVVDNLKNLKVLSTFIDGIDVLNGLIPKKTLIANNLNYVFPNNFRSEKLKIEAKTSTVKVIEVVSNELITNSTTRNCDVGSLIESNIEEDVLKIAVLSRYKENEIYVGLIRGFGLKKGALAASIAHDSHHIISVGCDDISIEKCLKFIVNNKGGMCYFDGAEMLGLPLPVYGLMSNADAETTAKAYDAVNARVINDGCNLSAPFMTMSFMSLSVIPHLKITPSGLFDVDTFNFTDLFI